MTGTDPGTVFSRVGNFFANSEKLDIIYLPAIERSISPSRPERLPSLWAKLFCIFTIDRLVPMHRIYAIAHFCAFGDVYWFITIGTTTSGQESVPNRPTRVSGHDWPEAKT